MTVVLVDPRRPSLIPVEAVELLKGRLEKVPKMEEKGEEITRESLEEAARRTSLKETTPEEIFWARQRGWREVAVVGRGLIERALNETEGVAMKKEL